MYQLHYDILHKIMLHQRIINDFRNEIKHLRIYNTLEDFYGKSYLRIYFELEINTTSSKQSEFYDRYNKDVSYYSNQNYISFYLPARTVDLTDLELENKEEQLHYDWICNLFEWYNYNKQPEIIIEPFVSQLDEKRKSEEWSKDYDNKRNLILDSLKEIRVQENHLLILRQYSGNFRIGRVSKTDSNGINLIEVKKDLSNGKREINYVRLYEIYAIVETKDLNSKSNKDIILDNIKNQINFDGLIYIRPKELW